MHLPHTIHYRDIHPTRITNAHASPIHMQTSQTAHVSTPHTHMNTPKHLNICACIKQHILTQVHNSHFRRKTPFSTAALISWTNLSTVTPPTMLDNTEVNTRTRARHSRAP